MPIYVYEREDGTEFEIIQKMSDAPLATCPTTGQKVTKKLSCTAAPVFKGSGFYQTDYCKSSSSSGGKSTKSSSDSSSKSTDTASATKKCGTGCGCH